MIRRILARLLSAIDPTLLALTVCLLSFSYVVMLSASAERIESHTINILVAMGIMLLVAYVPPQRLAQLAPPLYIVGILLLIGVATVGEVSKGAQRWLNLGFVRIQPSELLKIATPLMLAWYFQQREDVLKRRHFFFAMLLLLIPVALIAKQPDLGTAILVLAAGLFVIFFAGLSWKLVVPVMLVGVVLIAGIISYEERICAPEVKWPGLRDYQKHRICTLLDPASDPLGKGFHTIQSTIAIGSGGITGKGWMKGTQTHLDFLPERHTDFILAVISEELGLTGVCILLALYILLIGRGLQIALEAPTFFTRLLAGSITMSFFTYAFVNTGMVSGILPVVGVPLPFISYGGTALVTLSLGLGILMSIHGHKRLVKN